MFDGHGRKISLNEIFCYDFDVDSQKEVWLEVKDEGQFFTNPTQNSVVKNIFYQQ